MSAPLLPNLDRSVVPAPQQVEPPVLTNVQELTLDNGIPVYIIEGGTQEVTRIELAFDAGSWYQSKKLVATSASAMLIEGTSKLTGPELAAKLDAYGAFIQNEAAKDSATLTLYSLNRFWEQTLPLLESMVKDSSIPEQALAVNLSNRKQNFQVGMGKVSVRARQAFTSTLFGSDHPYGQQAEELDFDLVSRADVQAFYRERYQARHCSIFIAGRPPKEMLKALNDRLGASDWSREETPSPNFSLNTAVERHQLFLEKPDAVQSAIRIGRVMFAKNHPDYLGMQVLNTILGGYFGSRLMANLREDKGYTYGVGSGMASHRNGGYFFVSTEVKAEVAEQAVEEIYLEMGKLMAKAPDEKELSRVKNYLFGVFLRSVSGPFSQLERLRSRLFYGLPETYATDYLHRMQSVTGTELMELANRYWQKEHLVEVVAGPK